jgi:hypothetical protein
LTDRAEQGPHRATAPSDTILGVMKMSSSVLLTLRTV